MEMTAYEIGYQHGYYNIHIGTVARCTADAEYAEGFRDGTAEGDRNVRLNNQAALQMRVQS